MPAKKRGGGGLDIKAILGALGGAETNPAYSDSITSQAAQTAALAKYGDQPMKSPGFWDRLVRPGAASQADSINTEYKLAPLLAQQQREISGLADDSKFQRDLAHIPIQAAALRAEGKLDVESHQAFVDAQELKVGREAMAAHLGKEAASKATDEDIKAFNVLYGKSPNAAEFGRLSAAKMYNDKGGAKVDADTEYRKAVTANQIAAQDTSDSGLITGTRGARNKNEFSKATTEEPARIESGTAQAKLDKDIADTNRVDLPAATAAHKIQRQAETIRDLYPFGGLTGRNKTALRLEGNKLSAVTDPLYIDPMAALNGVQKPAVLPNGVKRISAGPESNPDMVQPSRTVPTPLRRPVTGVVAPTAFQLPPSAVARPSVTADSVPQTYILTGADVGRPSMSLPASLASRAPSAGIPWAAIDEKTKAANIENELQAKINRGDASREEVDYLRTLQYRKLFTEY